MPGDTPTRARPLVLVIDDVPAVIRMIMLELSAEGLDVIGARVGDDTFRTIERHKPDVALMEVMLPGLSGFELMRQVKQRHRTPVIFVTSQGADADRQYAMELGADDYITKPFSPRELAQRINLLLGRRTEGLRDVIRITPVELDLGRRVARREGETIALGQNEWAIIYALARKFRQPVPARDLLIDVFGADYAGEERYLELWIERLRGKVEEDAKHPRVITGDVASGYAIGRGEPRAQVSESA